MGSDDDDHKADSINNNNLGRAGKKRARLAGVQAGQVECGYGDEDTTGGCGGINPVRPVRMTMMQWMQSRRKGGNKEKKKESERVREERVERKLRSLVPAENRKTKEPGGKEAIVIVRGVGCFYCWFLGGVRPEPKNTLTRNDSANACPWVPRFFSLFPFFLFLLVLWHAGLTVTFSFFLGPKIRAGRCCVGSHGSLGENVVRASRAVAWRALGGARWVVGWDPGFEFRAGLGRQAFSSCGPGSSSGMQALGVADWPGGRLD